MLGSIGNKLFFSETLLYQAKTQSEFTSMAQTNKNIFLGDFLRPENIFWIKEVIFRMVSLMIVFLMT